MKIQLHKERQDRQAFKRNISERASDYTEFNEEIGHLENGTIVGIHHKSAVTTLVERLKRYHHAEIRRQNSARYLLHSQHMVSPNSRNFYLLFVAK